MVVFLEFFKGYWNVFFYGFICMFVVYKVGSYWEKYREKYLWMRGVYVILKNLVNLWVDEFVVFKRKYKIFYIKCRVFLSSDYMYYWVLVVLFVLN